MSVMRLYAAMVLATLLGGCQEDSLIEGVVIDNFSRPVVGAVVSIDNSSFTDSTDTSGRYSIEYVPADLRVRFEKQGFTSTSIDLHLNASGRYPMKDILLIQLPPDPGIYLQTSDDYVRLIDGRLEVKEHPVGFMERKVEFFAMMNGPTGLSREDAWKVSFEQSAKHIEALRSASTSKLVFIDSTGSDEAPYVVKTWKMGTYHSTPLGVRSNFVSPAEETTESNGIFVRTINLGETKFKLPPTPIDGVRGNQLCFAKMCDSASGLRVPCANDAVSHCLYLGE